MSANFPLQSRMRARRDSFTTLRIGLALLVLLDHSTYIFGVEKFQFFGTSLGLAAVALFFLISGYLVTVSAQINRPADFAVKRLLRIFPALIAVVILTAFLVAPLLGFINQNSIRVGIENVFYLDNIVLPLDLQHEIGAATSGMNYPDSINGSLWTLPIEIRLYAVSFFAAFLVGRLNQRGLLRAFIFCIFATTILLLALGVFERLNGLVGDIWPILVLYLTGMLCALLEGVGHNRLSNLLLISVTVVGFIYSPVLVVALVLILFSFFAPKTRTTRIPDFSYTAYLVVFPILQVTEALFSDALPYVVKVIISLGCSVLTAYGLTITVERKSQNLFMKKKGGGPENA